MATKYVSQTATNGYVVGNDSNDGLSKSAPWLTLDKVGSSLVSGDVIIFNDGDYLDTSLFSVAVNCTFQSENPGLSSIRSTNATRALYLNASAGNIDITLNGIVVDPQSASQNCISFAATANTYDVSLINGAELRNSTVSLFKSPGSHNLNLYIRDLVLSGSPSQSGFDLKFFNSGSVDVDRVSVNLTGQSADKHGVFSIIALATGVTASVKNVTGSLTLSASANLHHGVSITNIPNAIIEDCDIDILGGTGTASAKNYVIDSTGLDAANGSIIKPKGLHSAPGGIIALIGQDSSDVADPGKNKCNNGTITGGDMEATILNGTHGYMLGNSTGGEIYNNKVKGTAFCTIMKGQNEGLSHHNIGLDIYGVGFNRSKGSVNCNFYNNTGTSTGGSGNYSDTDATTAIASSGIEFKNNIIYFTGTASKLSFVAAGNTATFANNQYFSEVALTANPFSYSGTDYATFELWQAAQELTAQYGDPLFKNISIDNLKLNNNSPCIDVGVDVGLTTDFDGQRIPVGIAPDIGAFEFTLTALVNGSCAVGNLFSGINNRKGNISGNLKG